MGETIGGEEATASRSHCLGRVIYIVRIKLSLSHSFPHPKHLGAGQKREWSFGESRVPETPQEIPC